MRVAITEVGGVIFSMSFLKQPVVQTFLIMWGFSYIRILGMCSRIELADSTQAHSVASLSPSANEGGRCNVHSTMCPASARKMLLTHPSRQTTVSFAD